MVTGWKGRGGGVGKPRGFGIGTGGVIGRGELESCECFSSRPLLIFIFCVFGYVLLLDVMLRSIVYWLVGNLYRGFKG